MCLLNAFAELNMCRYLSTCPLEKVVDTLQGNETGVWYCAAYGSDEIVIDNYADNNNAADGAA